MQPPNSTTRQVLRTLELRGVHVRLENGQLTSQKDSGPIPQDMMLFLHHFNELIIDELQRQAGESVSFSSNSGGEQTRMESAALGGGKEPNTSNVLEGIKRLAELDTQQERLKQKLALEVKEPIAPVSPPLARVVISPVANPTKQKFKLPQWIGYFNDDTKHEITPVSWIWMTALFLFLLWGWAELTADDEQAGENCEVIDTGPYDQDVICDPADERFYDNEPVREDLENDASIVTNSGPVDCNAFQSQREAQQFFENNGGPRSDPYYLDGDGDGIACEWN